MLKGLLTMNAEEIERITVVRQIVDKHVTQTLAAKQLGLTVRQVKLDFMKNSHRRIPAAQTAGPMYGVLIYDNNQTQSGV